MNDADQIQAALDHVTGNEPKTIFYSDHKGRRILEILVACAHAQLLALRGQIRPKVHILGDEVMSVSDAKRRGVMK